MLLPVLSLLTPHHGDSFWLLLVTAFLLGLRHGVDWDHIAAIADLTSAPMETRQAMGLGGLYAAGHSFVLLLIGGTAVLLGAELPDTVDKVTEPLVGATLLVLGLVLLTSLLFARSHFRMRSRWMLLIAGGLGAYDWAHERVTHAPRPERRRIEQYTHRGAFGMGMLHGVGAETPTQVLLFAAAADAGGRGAGFTILLLFVGGLLCSNSGLSGLSAVGYMKARSMRPLALALGAVTGFFSTVVGILFLTGNGSVLPALFGG
ncbi:MAG: hypothetical protein ACR2PL_07450 [Dehalococcoidia bacterium]